jgi:hypothetical protein
MRWSIAALGILTIALGSAASSADTPPLPERVMKWQSANHEFIAISDPQSRITTIYAVSAAGVETKRWMMHGWFRFFEIADDGEHVVIPCEGKNVVPLDYRKDMPVFYFVRRGEVLSYVTLAQVISDWSKLSRTASHYAWEVMSEFRGTTYTVRTVEGKLISFDYKSGRRLPAR